MDVSNVFLHRELDEEVYMALLLGYTVSNAKHMCRLRKSLCAKLSKSLIQYRFNTVILITAYSHTILVLFSLPHW